MGKLVSTFLRQNKFYRWFNININWLLLEKNCTNDSTALLEDFLDDDFADTYVRPIRGPSISALHWSGSDGDMTWVCLFVVILALCFAIPLIVVIFWTHPHSSGNNNTTTTNWCSGLNVNEKCLQWYIYIIIYVYMKGRSILPDFVKFVMSYFGWDRYFYDFYEIHRINKHH